MKRFFVIAICVILIFALIGCSSESEMPQPRETFSAAATATPTPEPTATPEPTPTPFATMTEEMEGEHVNKLQERLKELDYLRIDNTTDYYGSMTVQAVERFQKQNGYEVSGNVSEEMWNIIFAEDAPKCNLPLAGYVIGIDPGHQAHGNNEKEPVSPGSSEMKAKVSSGTAGVASGVDEYKVNLAVGLILRDMLVEQGATVYMTRETNDVDISNVERAQFFNDHNTDYAIRLHCNGGDASSVHGAFMLIPESNPYEEDCKTAAQYLIDSFCEETGAKNLGITVRDDQTGFNWCDRMVVNIEMGHMSNPEEDLKLADESYQWDMAKGICNGIVKYFENK